MIQGRACAWYEPNTLENRRQTEPWLGFFHVCSTDHPSSCHEKDITPFPPSHQTWKSCQNINSLRECFFDHTISYLELSPALFQFPWCEKYPVCSFLPDPQIHSNVLLFEKLQLSTFGGEIICQHLLPNSLAWTGNLQMPPLRLFFAGHLTDCFKNKNYLKIQEKASSGKIIQENRGVEDFTLSPLFHVSLFPLKKWLSFSHPQSHAFSVLISQTLDPRI